MKELKSIKNKIIKFIAILASAILVAELAPFPVFVKTSKAAGTTKNYELRYNCSEDKYYLKSPGANEWMDVTNATGAGLGSATEYDDVLVKITVDDPSEGTSYEFTYFKVLDDDNEMIEKINVDAQNGAEFLVSNYWNKTIGLHDKDIFQLSCSYESDGLNTTTSHQLKINYYIDYYYNAELNNSTFTYGEPIDYTFTTNRPGDVGLKFKDESTGMEWFDDEGVPLSPLTTLNQILVQVYEDKGDSIEVVNRSLTYFDSMGVNKAKGVFTLDKAKIHPGEELPIKEVSLNFLDEKIDLMELNGYEVYYRPASSSDGLSEFSTTMPTKVGSYIATVEMVNSNSFNADDFEDYYEFPEVPFEIVANKEGKVTVSVEDIKYGQKPVVNITTSDYDKSKATIEYKKSDAADTTYSKTVPTDVGEYVVRVSFPENSDVLATSVTDEFTIGKADGTGSVQVSDVKAGEKIVVTLSSSTNGNSAKVYYKVKGADDSTYTTTVPVAVGNYMVKAVFPANDRYNEVTATAEFKISYSAATGYTLEGTKGDNAFYISDVKIVPTEGYQISTSANTGFTDSITISKTTKGLGVYFKHIETGSISERVTINNILIDKDAPTLAGYEKSGNAIEVYSDTFYLKVSDENIESILVNGKEQTFSDVNGNASIELIAENPVTVFNVTIKDKAGNTTQKKITIYQEWMKDRKVSSGKKLKLMPGYDYSLESGEWTVEGDNTVYAGGTKIYVSEEVEVVFKQ